MNFSPSLPKHFHLSKQIQDEIAELSADLGLVLVAKSHLPVLLSPYQVVHYFDADFGFAVRFGEIGVQAVEFLSDLRPYLRSFNKLDEQIESSRALCERLCVRNHKRKFNVYESSDNTEVLSFDW